MAIRMLRGPLATERTGDSRSGLHRKVQAGLFPPPVKIGERASAWPEHEVDAVNAARIAGKSDDEIRELVRRLVAARSEMASFARSGGRP